MGDLGNLVQGRGGRLAAQDGMTLVELMVSFFLLSIILASVAASLITFTRATADNERRVEATALLNRLHEELQATPWVDAAIYDGESGPLLDPTDGIAPTLDGRDLVSLPGPSATDCDVTEPECNRRARVPRTVQTFDRSGLPVDDDDPDVYFTALQAVTWTDGSQQTKRFTTVVRWELLGRQLEEVFESERTATAAEAGDPTLPRVVQFQVGPSPMGLSPQDASPPQRHLGDLNVVVRFSEPIDSAVLRFYQVKTPATDASGQIQLEEVVVSLTPALFDDTTAKPYEFRTVLPAGTYRFPDGSRLFRAVGALGAETFAGATSASFTGGGLAPTPDPGSDDVDPIDPPADPEDPVGDPPAEEVSITDVTVTPISVCMDTEFRFAQDVTISANVRGMTVDDNDVSLGYETQSLGAVSQAMQPRFPTSVSPSGAVFDVVLEAGKDHGFRPQGSGSNAREQTSFKINATRRSDDGSAGPVLSATFTATRHKC